MFLRKNAPSLFRFSRVPLPADSGLTPPPSPPPKYHVAGRRKSDPNTCLIVGLILGGTAVFMIFFIGILAAILLPALARAREAARRAACAGNLKQVAMVCRLYASKQPDGSLPPLSGVEGRFMFTPDSVYPDILFDLNILACPSDTDASAAQGLPPEQAIDDYSYYYLGYALTSEDEALAFIESYPAFIAQGADFTQELPAPPGRGSFGGDVFLRLRENVCDGTGFPSARVPIMFDSGSSSGSYGTFNHIPAGCNVVFLDGHVEFFRFPGEFPVSPAFLDALSALDEAAARKTGRGALE